MTKLVTRRRGVSRAGMAGLALGAAMLVGISGASVAAATEGGCPTDAAGHGIATFVLHANSSAAPEPLSTCDGQPIEVTQSAQAALERVYNWTIDKQAVGLDRVAADAELASFTFDVIATPAPASAGKYELTGAAIFTNPNPWPVEVAIVADAELGAGADCAFDAPPEAQGPNGHVIVPGTDPTAATEAPSAVPLLPVGASNENGRLVVGVICDVAESVAINGVSIADIDWSAVAAQIPENSLAGPARLGDSVWQMTFVRPVVTVVDDHAEPGGHYVLGSCTWTPELTPCVFSYDLDLPAPGPGESEIMYPNAAWLEEAPDVRDDALVFVSRDAQLAATGEEDDADLTEESTEEAEAGADDALLEEELEDDAPELAVTGGDMDGGGLPIAAIAGGVAAIAGVAVALVLRRKHAMATVSQAGVEE